MKKVNIITSDRGWILEKLASEITKRYPYVQYTNGNDPSAAIQYYMTYSCWSRKYAPVEISLFTHLEEAKGAEAAYRKFFDVAKFMNHSVCMSNLYEKMLNEDGVTSVTTISPGVDLDFFSLKLRIGVVGRTYHTGRKGEHIVKQLMDIPEIEWYFTGEGWPGPALNLPADKLPDFYRDMDYILVPALYEGGPMCVVEALACGREVIAPPIGWVTEFPHIEYKTGDVQDLRRVLLSLIDQKKALRQTTLDRTWENWAEGHHQLFQKLFQENEALISSQMKKEQGPALVKAYIPGNVGLVIHGNEKKSLGGPSVRTQGTAKGLQELEIDAQVIFHPEHDLEQFDLVHVFNVWAPHTALKALRRARYLEKPIVFSPILLDLSERDLWADDIPELFERLAPDHDFENELSKMMQTRKKDNKALYEAIPGYRAMIREMASLADHLIFLSQKEKSLMVSYGADVSSSTIVHNPVQVDFYAHGDPDIFRKKFGLDKFVLCVGRIEARKNQLILARALRGTGIPLVLAGHYEDNEYIELIRKHADENVIFTGRLEAGSPMLRSAYAAASVFALPSWCEGASLANLEAAASGIPMIVGNRASEAEYFGDIAEICDPGDIKGIRQAVLRAIENEKTKEQRARQSKTIARQFGWERYCRETLDVYHKTKQHFQPVRRGLTRPTHAIQNFSGERIVFDVTTSANRKGRWTGISRVEMALAVQLQNIPEVEVDFVLWANKHHAFIDVPRDIIGTDKLQEFFQNIERSQTCTPAQPKTGSHFVVVGSGWMQNSKYTKGVCQFSSTWELELSFLICDIIPVYHPFWFEDGYSRVFEQNLNTMLSSSFRILAISEATKRDIKNHCQKVLSQSPEVGVIRLGDDIRAIPNQSEISETNNNISFKFKDKPFIISVGAIHLRKNHGLLYDVWQRLVDQFGPKCPHLVIVGGVAWNGHETARAMRNDEKVNGFIHILDDVEDDDLEWLYQNSLFTVYPSRYEGYGLPIAESLRYGRVCLTSNTSSMVEVDSNLTELLDPLDYKAWLTTIAFYAGSPIARQQREEEIKAGFKPTSWKQTAQSFVDAISIQAKRALDPPHYHLGSIVSFNNLQQTATFATGRWHGTERWGEWSAGEKVGLVFRLLEKPSNDFIFVLSAQAIFPNNKGLSFTVAVDERDICTCQFKNKKPHVFTIPIHSTDFDNEGCLRIKFTNQQAYTISEVKKCDDHRKIGIGVIAAILLEKGNSYEMLTHYKLSEQCVNVNINREDICAHDIDMNCISTKEKNAEIKNNCTIICSVTEHPDLIKTLDEYIYNNTNKCELIIIAGREEIKAHRKVFEYSKKIFTRYISIRNEAQKLKSFNYALHKARYDKIIYIKDDGEKILTSKFFDLCG